MCLAFETEAESIRLNSKTARGIHAVITFMWMPMYDPSQVLSERESPSSATFLWKQQIMCYEIPRELSCSNANVNTPNSVAHGHKWNLQYLQYDGIFLEFVFYTINNCRTYQMYNTSCC